MSDAIPSRLPKAVARSTGTAAGSLFRAAARAIRRRKLAGRSILFTWLLVANMAHNAQAGFLKTWGGSGDDRVISMTLDSATNVILGGDFVGTVDFNPTGPIHSNLTSNGQTDAFICKYDRNGNFQWAKSWGGTDLDRVSGVTADSKGNIYAIGCFRQTNDFNPQGPLHTNLVAINQDAFLCKFNASGQFQWVRHWGGASSDEGYVVKVDPSDDDAIYCVGDFHSSTIDFNPEPASGTSHDIHTNFYNSMAFGYDGYLCRWSSNGTFRWARTWGGDGYDDCDSLAVDGLGHVYCAGFVGSGNNTCDFNCNTGTPHVPYIYNAVGSVQHEAETNLFFTDVFLTQFNTNGVWQWSRCWGGTNGDAPQDLAVDVSGNVYVAGYIGDTAYTNYGMSEPGGETVDFNPVGPVHSNLTEHLNGMDVFFCKYDPNGVFQWARLFGGSNPDTPCSIVVDSYGYIELAGTFASLPCNFDPGPGTSNLSASAGTSAIFVGKYDSRGNLIMARASGGSGGGMARVALDADGNMFLAGQMQSTVDFGPLCSGPVTNSNGGYDCFLSRLYAGPTMAIYSNSSLVQNNDRTPAKSKGTDFGSVNLGLSVYTNTLTITNTGYGALYLTGITVTGNLLGVSVDTGGATNIGIGASIPIRLVFSPWDDTPRTGVVTICGNDAASGAYAFNVSGCGIATGPTQFITAASGAFGSISPSGSVPVTGGGKRAFTNTPNSYFHVASVVVDSITQGMPSVYIFTNVVAAHTITNTFAPDLSPSNTPNWWLAQYGLTNSGLSFSQAETNDFAGSGIPAWAGYVAGTDPTSRTNVFAVFLTSTQAQEVVWVPTILPTPQYGNCSRCYTFETTTNLQTGPWTSIVSCVDMPATSGSSVAFTNRNAASSQFYRGRVRLIYH